MTMTFGPDFSKWRDNTLRKAYSQPPGMILIGVPDRVELHIWFKRLMALDGTPSEEAYDILEDLIAQGVVYYDKDSQFWILDRREQNDNNMKGDIDD